MMTNLITPSRRGFIAGLGALIVAPVIIPYTNLMPVKAVDDFYSRYIFDYNVAYDAMMVRCDKASFPLKLPNCVKILSEKEALNLVRPDIARRMKSLKPGINGGQVHIVGLVATSEDWMGRTGAWQRWRVSWRV